MEDRRTKTFLFVHYLVRHMLAQLYANRANAPSKKNTQMKKIIWKDTQSRYKVCQPTFNCVMIRLTSHSCSSRFFDTKPAFISAWIWLRRLSCLRSSSLISSGVSGRFGLVDVDVIGGLYLFMWKKKRCKKWRISVKIGRFRCSIMTFEVFCFLSEIEWNQRKINKNWTFLKMIASISKCHKTYSLIFLAFWLCFAVLRFVQYLQAHERTKYPFVCCLINFNLVSTVTILSAHVSQQ